MPRKRIAFVASGGAVKAACFHAGVCLALQEKGFRLQGGSIKNPRYPESEQKLIDIYVGSSAGSIISAFLASGFSIEDVVASFAGTQKNEVLPKLSYREMFHFRFPNWKTPFRVFEKKMRLTTHTSGIEGLLRNYLFMPGFASTVGIEKYLRKVLPSNKFNDLAADFFVVATQLNRPRRTIFGKFSALEYLTERTTCEYSDKIEISNAVAGSIALPPFYRPYKIKFPDGKEEDFYDGEIRKTLSTHVAKDAGANLIFASYTHQPYEFAKEAGSLADIGMTPIMTQAIYQTVEQKIASNRRYNERKQIVLDTVNSYFKENQLPDLNPILIWASITFGLRLKWSPKNISWLLGWG